MKKIVVYGAEWCPKTAGFRNYLQSEFVDFEYIDLEANEDAAEKIKGLYGGHLKFPVVEVDEELLLNPAIPQLRNALKDGDYI